MLRSTVESERSRCQPRNRQLFGHVPQQRVGETEVAFGVLEVDRIDLVRHRRRPDLAFLDALAEVTEGDVAPNVAIEIDEHRVGARDRIEQLGHVVVRLDLRRVGIELEPEARHHPGSKVLPFDIRISDDVRVVIADGTVRLPLEGHALDRCDLALEARVDVGHLLAKRGRRRRLAVRARQHRQRGVGMRQRFESGGDVAKRGQEHLCARFREHHAVREIVDVLRRAREVNEFADPRNLGDACEALLQPILDRLDVVVGRALDRLHAGRVVRRERRRSGLQRLSSLRAKRRDFGNLRFVRQRDQPGDFDLHPGADETVFAEDAGEGRDLRAVAAVQGRQRREGGVGFSHCRAGASGRQQDAKCP
jgi:hypothetical protein